MFSVKHNECVGFESRWKVKKISSVGSTQTISQETSDMETSTSEKQDVEVQTEIQQTPHVEVDEEKLAAWLKQIYPKVKKELDDMTNSKAFRGYKLSTDCRDANCKLMQILDLKCELEDPNNALCVSALSWNSVNKTLAVSCTSYKHQSWCYHVGVVILYTLDRDDDLSEFPTGKLKTESCITALQFHAVLPGIIAVGLFNGKIIIWNTEKEDEEYVTKIDGHSDGISQLSWIPDINYSKNILLVSSSLDGILTLWSLNNRELRLKVKEKHQIRCPLFPKASGSGEMIKKIIRGITCFDFSKHNPDIFVVGAEGGMVVHCSLFGTTKLPGSTKELPLLDSSVKYYESHKDEITSIGFSPNRKDMFMTTGSDLEIRIYIIDQEEPAQVIFLKTPLNSVVWVPYAEKIICGCGKNGVPELFQVVKGKPIENVVKDNFKKEILTQIQINPAKTNIVAIGTTNGHVQMWRIPWGFFKKM